MTGSCAHVSSGGTTARREVLDNQHKGEVIHQGEDKRQTAAQRSSVEERRGGAASRGSTQRNDAGEQHRGATERGANE